MLVLRVSPFSTTKTPAFAALWFVAIMLFTATPVRADVRADQCSRKTTEGRYFVVCEGYLTPGPNAPLVAAKELGVVTGDENGTFTGKGTLSLGGQVVEQTVRGTEQLEPDCTGTITYTQTINGQPAPDFHDVFVVSDHGKRIDGLGADPGSIFSCVLRRLDDGRNDRDDH
jgi:hypothetical protein